jgi:hypothetical protein
MKLRWLAVLLLAASSAAPSAEAKPGTPGPPYFTGIYERVGRDGAQRLLNDRVSILPLGQGVAIRACQGAPLQMGFGPAFEINTLMTGAQGPVGFECLFHNNGYNRPILTCRGKDGAAFTLWPTRLIDLSCG